MKWRLAGGSSRYLFLVVAIAGAAIGLVTGMQSGPSSWTIADSGRCPEAENITNYVKVEISGTNRQLDIEPTLQMQLTGVTPAESDWEAIDLTSGSPNFARCLVGGGGRLQYLDWSDGKLTARFELDSIAYYGDGENQRYAPPVIARVAFRSSQLAVDLCQGPSALRTEALLCRRDARTTVDVNIVGLEDRRHQPVATPFPQRIEKRPGETDFTWRFDGQSDEVTVSFSVPWLAALDTYTRADGGVGTSVVDIDGLEVNLKSSFASYALPALVVLFMCAVVLRPRWVAIRFLVLAIGIAVLGGVQAYIGEAHVSSVVGTAGVAVFGLTAVIASIAPLLPTFVALLIAALAEVQLFYLITTKFESNSAALALIGIACCVAALLVLAAVTLFTKVTVVFSLRGDDASNDFGFRRVIECSALMSLFAVVAFPVGSALSDTNEETSRAYDFAREISQISVSAVYPLVQLIPLLAVSTLSAYVLRRMAHLGVAGLGAIVISTMLVLAAPWSDSGALVLIAGLPLWLLQLAIVWGFIRSWLHRVVPAVNESRETLLVAVRAPGNGERLLLRGPSDSVLDSVRLTTTWAGYLSVVPVLYFAWTALDQLDENLNWGTGALIVVIGLVSEAVRWIVTGFVFAWLYPMLPGRIGPVKAVVFSAVWAASCLGPIAVARGFGLGMIDEFIYRSAQLALFVIVLALIMDVATIKAANGSWRDLRQVYSLHHYGEFVAAVAPAALVTITLTQQILAGSGFEVASSFVSGLTDVFK